MSDQPEQQPSESTPPTPPATPPEPQGASEQLFTQADIDRIIADRLKRDRDAQEKKMLESLGVQSSKELADMLDAKRKSDEAQLSEIEKIQKQADAERLKREDLEKQLASLQARQIAESRKAVFLDAVTQSGGKDVARLFVLVNAELGDQFDSLFETDGTTADDKQLAAFIKDVQGKFPLYFGTSGAGSPSNENGISPNANPMKEAERMTKKFGRL